MSKNKHKTPAWVAEFTAVPQGMRKPHPKLRAANEFALRMALTVLGMHHDPPRSTGSAWSPRATESWAWNPHPAPLQPIQKQRCITCELTKSHTSEFPRNWCPASPPCTLPVPNAQVALLWGVLCLPRTMEDLTFLSEGASKFAP